MIWIWDSFIFDNFSFRFFLLLAAFCLLGLETATNIGFQFFEPRGISQNSQSFRR